MVGNMCAKMLSLVLLLLSLSELILCEDEYVNITKEKMQHSPFITCGNKTYIIEIELKNYFRASEFCRFHGWNLAAIDTQEQDRCLEEHIQRIGLTKNHFWLGGSDLGKEGLFVWHSTGRPVTYTNWHEQNPNNFCVDKNRCENCLGLRYVKETGRKWNDFICDHELNFICEE